MTLFPPVAIRRCSRLSPCVSVRLVSTTSAINRGLRASRPAGRRDGGGRQAAPTRIRKHTSQDGDSPFNGDAPAQRVRSRATRSGRRESSGGGDRGRDVRAAESGFTSAARDGREDVGRSPVETERRTSFGKRQRESMETSVPPRSSYSGRRSDERRSAGAFGRERRDDDLKERRPRRDAFPEQRSGREERGERGEREDRQDRPRMPTTRSTEYKAARDGGAPRRSFPDHTEDPSRSFRSRDRDEPERRSERKAERSFPRSRDEPTNGSRQADRPPRAERSGDRAARREWAERKPQQDRPAKWEWTERKPSEDRPARSSTRIDNDDDVPVSIPYSTASSQFLYGTNSVLAALKAQRRKCHHLHVRDSRTIGRDSDASNDKTELLVRLARQSSIKVSHSASLRLLDKMSDDRPHNGVALEASALPAPPLVALGTLTDNKIPLTVDRQSSEDLSTNGSPATLPAPSNRAPLILFLDGITDPGNVGAILRTAHFFNVDAVAVATNTCANLASPVLAKASAGACEAVPIFAVKKPAEFIYKSKKDGGWKIYAAVAPTEVGKKGGRRQKSSVEISGRSPLFSDNGRAGDPVILMLGAEGEGLRENLRSKADVEVVIERGLVGHREQRVDVGVDSVNVSVAAGVLVEAFMRRPVAATRQQASAESTMPEAVEVITTSATEGDEAVAVGLAKQGDGGGLGF